MSERLKREDWIAEGLRTLGRQGASGLKIGAMAARLKVSRGSFYWHFPDLRSFENELLRTWQEQATGDVVRMVDARDPPERLLALMMRAFNASRDLDRAMRMWAIEDPRVAEGLATADAARLAYLASLLETAGLDGTRAKARAAFLYWAYLGQTFVAENAYSALDETAIRDICCLLETK